MTYQRAVEFLEDPGLAISSIFLSQFLDPTPAPRLGRPKNHWVWNGDRGALHRGGQQFLSWPSGAARAVLAGFPASAPNSSEVRVLTLECGRSRLDPIRHCSILLGRSRLR